MRRSLLVPTRSQDRAPPPRTSHGHGKRLRDRPEPAPSQRPALCRTWAGNDPRGRTTTAFGAPRGPPPPAPAEQQRRPEPNAAIAGRSRAGKRRSGGSCGSPGCQQRDSRRSRWILGPAGRAPAAVRPPRSGGSGTLRRRGRAVRERLPGSACFGLRPGEAAGCASRSPVR